MSFAALTIKVGATEILHPVVFTRDGQWFLGGANIADRQITRKQAVVFCQRGVLPIGEARRPMEVAVAELHGKVPNMPVTEWIETLDLRNAAGWYWQYGRPHQSTLYRNVRRGAMAAYRVLSEAGVWEKGITNADFDDAWPVVWNRVADAVWCS